MIQAALVTNSEPPLILYSWKLGDFVPYVELKGCGQQYSSPRVWNGRPTIGAQSCVWSDVWYRRSDVSYEPWFYRRHWHGEQYWKCSGNWILRLVGHSKDLSLKVISWISWPPVFIFILFIFNKWGNTEFRHMKRKNFFHIWLSVVHLDSPTGSPKNLETYPVRIHRVWSVFVDIVVHIECWYRILQITYDILVCALQSRCTQLGLGTYKPNLRIFDEFATSKIIKKCSCP